MDACFFEVLLKYLLRKLVTEQNEQEKKKAFFIIIIIIIWVFFRWSMFKDANLF